MLKYIDTVLDEDKCFNDVFSKTDDEVSYTVNSSYPEIFVTLAKVKLRYGADDPRIKLGLEASERAMEKYRSGMDRNGEKFSPSMRKLVGADNMYDGVKISHDQYVQDFNSIDVKAHTVINS